MKKRYLIAAIGLTAVFSMSAAACAGSTLVTPTDFSIDENYNLSWSPVEDARSYRVEITPVGGETMPERTSRRTSYALAGLDEGDYEIRVMAVGGRQNASESRWSEPVSFHKDYETGCIYTLINNNTEYQLNRVGTASGDFEIEEIYRGKPVTKINDGAFRSSRSIVNVVIGKRVTSIGANAFYQCTALESVTLTDKVQSIGDAAFQGCQSLKSIHIPASITSVPKNAFAYCYALGEVELEEGLEEIGESAFYYCSALEEITIPDSVVSIGEYAFSLEEQLRSVKLGDGVASLGNNAFYNDPALTDVQFGEAGALKTIGEYAFARCDALASLTVPEGVETLSAYCFYGDSTLGEIDLPDSLTKIGQYAFDFTKLYEDQRENGLIYADHWLVGATTEKMGEVQRIMPSDFEEGLVGIAGWIFIGCPKLERVEFPETLKYIGDYAFYANPMLTRVLAGPDSVEYIGVSAFASNTLLSNVQFASGLKKIDNYAFAYCPLLDNNQFSDALIPETVTEVGTDAFYETALWSKPDEYGVVYAGNWVVGADAEKCAGTVQLSDEVAGVANYAFYDCADLENLVGLNRAEHLGAGAFFGCRGLSLISLNRNLRRIEPYTFFRCESLFNVNFPTRLTSIGDYAFYCCSSLNELDFSETSLTEVGWRAFYGCTNIKSIAFSDCLETIGDDGFYRIYGLTELTLPDSLTSLGFRSFAKCENLRTIKFGSGLEEIGEQAFRNCTSLWKLELPDTLKKVGDFAFYQCVNLRYLSLGSVTEIGRYAFCGDECLSALVIPESVLSIGEYAFKGCKELRSVVFRGLPEWIGNHAFYGCLKLTFYSAAEQAPEWSGTWNSSYRPVMWQSTLSEEGYVVSMTLNEQTAQFVYAQGGISAPARTGYDFVGWATAPGAAEAEYQPNELYRVPFGTVLYAVWAESEEEPQEPDLPTIPGPSSGNPFGDLFG